MTVIVPWSIALKFVNIKLITIHYLCTRRCLFRVPHHYIWVFQVYSSFDFIFAANYGSFSISTLKRKESNKLLCLCSFHQWYFVIRIGLSMVLEFCEPPFSWIACGNDDFLVLWDALCFRMNFYSAHYIAHCTFPIHWVVFDQVISHCPGPVRGRLRKFGLEYVFCAWLADNLIRTYNTINDDIKLSKNLSLLTAWSSTCLD